MPSESDNSARFIASCLRLAAEDLKDAEVLHARGSRSDTYHLEQAVEKMLKAIMTSEGVHLERKDAHQLDVAVRKMPDDHPLREDFAEAGFLTEYATTYRYPMPSGRIKPNLASSKFDDAYRRARELLERLAEHFDVADMHVDATEPAKNTKPMRTTAADEGIGSPRV